MRIAAVIIAVASIVVATVALRTVRSVCVRFCLVLLFTCGSSCLLVSSLLIVLPLLLLPIPPPSWSVFCSGRLLVIALAVLLLVFCRVVPVLSGIPCVVCFRGTPDSVGISASTVLVYYVHLYYTEAAFALCTTMTRPCARCVKARKNTNRHGRERLNIESCTCAVVRTTMSCQSPPKPYI